MNPVLYLIICMMCAALCITVLFCGIIQIAIIVYRKVVNDHEETTEIECKTSRQ